MAQLVKNLLQCRRPEFNPWLGKIPWRRERLPTPVFWPGEFHGLYSPWGPKELDTTEWLSLSLWGCLYVWICIKYITNENLMYSPGNSTWSSVETQMGRKSPKRGDVCIRMADSLCSRNWHKCKEAMYMCAQLCLTLCNSIDCSLPGSTCPCNFPGKNLRVGWYFLLQRIFPNQGYNSHLLHWQVGSLPLHHLGSQESNSVCVFSH